MHVALQTGTRTQLTGPGNISQSQYMYACADVHASNYCEGAYQQTCHMALACTCLITVQQGKCKRLADELLDMCRDQVAWG